MVWIGKVTKVLGNRPEDGVAGDRPTPNFD